MVLVDGEDAAGEVTVVKFIYSATPASTVNPQDEIAPAVFHTAESFREVLKGYVTDSG